MRALKILVVVMGIMLVVGFGVVIATIAGRLSHSRTAPQPLAGGPIEIPRGARVEAMTAGMDRLVLALALPEGGRQLLIIDLVTGARLGTIELRASP